MTVSGEAEHELARLAPGTRPGVETDQVGGITPRRVAEPATPEAVAAVLAWATLHRQPVVIRGGATHLEWGRRPADVGLVVSTSALNRVTRYEPGDLTVTAEAGLPVAALNRELARHGQWLPIDVPSIASTVGGAIATNDSGPLRHRYGTPRDQIIGVHLATADGRIASAGGQVVKNVAGYDLSKLVAGSFGTLAGIVSATFKLAPIPAAYTTLVATFGSGEAMAQAVGAVAASQLDPMCIEAEATFGRAPVAQLVVRFGGTPGANDEQATMAAALVATASPTSSEILDGDEERSAWKAHAERRGRRTSGTDLRASWLPGSLAAVLSLLHEIAAERAVEIELSARAAVGAGEIHVEGDNADRMAVVSRLRARPQTMGHVVVTRAGVDASTDADIWGAALSSAGVSAALKRALDPAGVLNAGRGPI